MKRFVLTAVLAILLSLSLCLSALAVSLPSGTAEKSTTIYHTTLYGTSTSKVVSMIYYSSSNGYLGTTLAPTWSTCTKDVYNQSLTAAWYSVTASSSQPYEKTGKTILYQIPQLMQLDCTLYDIYLGTTIRVYYPDNGLYMAAAMYPIYTSLDGESSISDTSHAQSPTSTYVSVTINGSSYIKRDHKFEYFGVPASWIPDGYVLSGFGITWTMSGTLTGTSYYYYPNVKAYCYLKSDANTRAIEAQTEALSGVISDSVQNQTDALVANQNENTDKIIANQNENTDKMINEDFGYETPTNPNTDDGLDAGNELLGTLTDKMSGFGDEINDAQDTLSEGMNQSGNIITSIVGALPGVVTGLITAMIAFVVIRKVVGR